MARREGFEDISDGVDGQQGIFGEPTLDGKSAFSEYAQAKTQPHAQGLAIHFRCEGCGRPRTTVATFPELIAIKYGLQPQVALQPLVAQGRLPGADISSWGYDQEHQGWFPDLRCSCSWSLRPIISVAEAVSAINQGLSRQSLPMSMEQALSNYCDQFRRSRGG